MSTKLWFAAVGVIFVLFQCAQAAGDAHDALVYSRYRTGFQPTIYKVDRKSKQTQLDVPATMKDVADGKAVFSLEGLGEARVWRLPGDVFPVMGFPSAAGPGTQYSVPAGTAEVCQAEELNVGGKWKRYFGLVSKKGAAIVPAEEMELWWHDAPWYPQEELFADMWWGITVPGPKPGFWKRETDETPKIGDPLPVALHLRNTTRDSQKLPSTWYKDTQHGGPAMINVVSLSLAWAPFDSGYPVRKQFVDVPLIRDTHFAPDAEKRVVKKQESCELLAFDLRDWFKVEREGYYRVGVNIDWKSLGLQDKVYFDLGCSRVFAIGKPPTLPSIAAFNKKVPALGGIENEKRLKRVIRETVTPKSVKHKPLPANVEDLLAWSKPVKGLAARVEHVWAESVFFVRLKNVSDQPLTVPTGNPSDEKAALLFELYVQQGSSPWRRAAETSRYVRYFSAPPEPEGRNRASRGSRLPQQQPADRPWVTLQPGEDCIALVAGSDEQDSGEAKIARVVLRQPDASIPERWSGVLETPPQPIELSLEQYRILRAVLPFPNHFPSLSYDYSGFINQSPMASAAEGLHGPNRPLIDMLKLYEPAGVCKEFKRRMLAEKVMPMKLLLASVAAAAGSEDAAMLFLETTRDTDYRTVVNLHYALWITFWNYSDSPPTWQKGEPPDWLVELCLAILSDDRFVTGLNKTNYQEGTSFKVSSCETGHLMFALGDHKCCKAVPLLIDRVKRGQADFDTLNALGKIGDARATPALIGAFNAMSKGVHFDGDFDGTAFTKTAYALGELKAHEAVPFFLKHVECPEIIDCLGEIGDERAVPALREIATAKGRIVHDGKPVNPELQDERTFAANVALARLDGKNEVLHLVEMLADPTLERNHRYDVVLRLARRPDPRAIPHLVKLIKTDLDHHIIDMAIQALSEFKFKAAVEGLIDCFDVVFKEENLGKGEHVTATTYHNLIARSLQRITGQPFGADKQQWLKWWQENGKQSTELTAARHLPAQFAFVHSRSRDW